MAKSRTIRARKRKNARVKMEDYLTKVNEAGPAYNGVENVTTGKLKRADNAVTYTKVKGRRKRNRKKRKLRSRPSKRFCFTPVGDTVGLNNGGESRAEYTSSSAEYTISNAEYTSTSVVYSECNVLKNVDCDNTVAGDGGNDSNDVAKVGDVDEDEDAEDKAMRRLHSHMKMAMSGAWGDIAVIKEDEENRVDEYQEPNDDEFYDNEFEVGDLEDEVEVDGLFTALFKKIATIIMMVA